MTFSRRIVITITLAIFLLAAMTLALKPPPANEQILSDGTIVRLGQISYGKNHRYVTGNVAQRFAGRILPDKMAKAIGAKVHLATNATDKLFFFVEYHNQKNTQEPARWYSPAALIVSDVLGNEFVGNGAMYRSRTGSNLVEGFNIPMESHLSENLKIRVCPYDYVHQSNYTAYFTAKNPGPRSVSQWSAKPLPQTNQFGDLQVIFLDAKSTNAPPEAHRDHMRTWTCMHVQILQNGLPPGEVRANGVMVTDEAGQTYQPSFVGFPADTNGISRLLFAGALNPKEAWKFKCNLTHFPASETNQQWFVDQLALPEKPQKYAPEISSVVQGFKITIDQLNRKGLRLTITPKTYDLSGTIVLKTGDRNGKRIELLENGNGNYRLKIPEDVKSVGLEFALTKNQTAEFITKPSGK